MKQENLPQMTQMSADLGEGQIPSHHLRKSATSADHLVSPAPHEIEVHIEELVLHGFDPQARWSVADALENQLRGLLAERGVPAAWLSSPERLATTIQSGERLAETVYRGGAK